MENVVILNDFNSKFSKLSKQNKKYIIAVQQALLYAQDSETAEKMNGDQCEDQGVLYLGQSERSE